MSYLDEGTGEPVVMVHGNPTWSFYWRHLVLALRGEYRCIAPDHIGCGLSDKPTAAEYDFSLKSRIDDLEALLDSLGVTSDIMEESARRLQLHRVRPLHGGVPGEPHWQAAQSAQDRR